MTPPQQPADDFDSPWKDALHYYFQAFLAFFFADIHAEIDWRVHDMVCNQAAWV